MSLKTLREDLCRHQCEELPRGVAWAVRDLIRLIDRHRPLNAAGKHANLHTPTCGCEDKPVDARAQRKSRS